MALTARDIELSAPGKLHDGAGLYLDKRSDTSASWLYKYTWQGKATEVGLGSLKRVPLEEARKLREWCENEIRGKRSPKETLRGEKAAAKEEAKPANPMLAMSIEALVREHTGKIAKKAKAETTREDWRRHMSAAKIGKLAAMRPADVTIEDVAEVFEPLFQTEPPTAEAVLARLGRVMRWARSLKLIPGADWVNPCEWEALQDRIEYDDWESKNHASLDGDLVPDFFLRMNDKGGVVVLAMEWVILSACRVSSGVAARWDEIDMKRMCWTIPVERMKVKKNGDHRVPLSARHLEILEQAKIYNPACTGLIFPAPNSDGPVGRSYTNTLAKRLYPEEKLTIHGFRASFATWAEEQMIEAEIIPGVKQQILVYQDKLIEQCLAHVVGDAAMAAYRRKDALEARRSLMNHWALHCTSALRQAGQPGIKEAA